MNRATFFRGGGGGGGSGEDEGGADPDGASEGADEGAHDYAEALKPLLVDGVDSEAVTEVLDTRSTFAEDDLARFLPLIGIAEEWADLSYRYYERLSELEMVQTDGQMCAHLKYAAEEGDDETGPSLKLI